MTTEFKVGDLVKHTSKFLQSVGWYTNVPKDGKVTEMRPMGHEVWPVIQWCDDDTARMINPVNIMPAGKPDYSGM